MSRVLYQIPIELKELNAPTNKKQLQSFLGMINYLRAIIPNLSEIITPFRELLKKKYFVELEQAM